MPRPKLHSDEAVIAAAQRVLLEKGPSEFTLSDVAAEIGVSRAALIQRFESKHRLHWLVMERSTQEVRDYFAQAPRTVGALPLWTMLADLISGMGPGEGFSGYLLLEWADVENPDLNALARERNRLVRAAIEERLPPDLPDLPAMAGLIQAVIQGATMQWLIEADGTLDRFVLEQTAKLLTLLFPQERFVIPSRTAKT